MDEMNGDAIDVLLESTQGSAELDFAAVALEVCPQRPCQRVLCEVSDTDLP